MTHAPARSIRPGQDWSGDDLAADLVHPIASTVLWVRTAIGCDSATVRVLFPDESGRLHAAIEAGARITAGRRRSQRRREAFVTTRSTQLRLTEPPGYALAFVPLIDGGSPIGLVEVAAPAERLERHREILETVVSQAAAVFRTTRSGRESVTALREAGGLIRLAAELLRATSPDAAVRATVLACFEQTRSPVACLLRDARSGSWSVAAVRGLGSQRRAALGAAAESLGSELEGRPTDRALAAAVAARLTPLLGAGRVDAAPAGPAILIALEVPDATTGSIRTAGSLLGDALERLEAEARSRRPSEDLDLALACTAHELKSPLVGARAALHHVLDSSPDPSDRALLRRTQQELGQLVDLVDPLLRWSAGSGSLRRRRTDLVRIVRDAVTSCSWERRHLPVRVDAPGSVEVRADATQLRGAIANVVRNAMAYSPPAGEITVVVETDDDVVSVSVNDQGPGVPAAESRTIFDPFARGRAGRSSGGGQGLGLFIARKVVEAHGGSIDLSSEGPSTTFRIALPLAEEGGRRSAS